jgi:hypothetical protein
MKLNGTSKWNVAGAGALALLMSTSVFAAPAPRDGYDRNANNSRYDQRNDNRNNNRGNDQRNDNGRYDQRNDNRGSYRGHRENERIKVRGHITAVSRQNGGYLVQVDRGRDWYWIPQARMRNRGRNTLRVGVSLDLGGIFRGGRIEIDSLNWLR